MIKLKKYFQVFIVLFFFKSNAFASIETSIQYEKFYRLNKPQYKSESGDLFDLGIKSEPIVIENNKIQFSIDANFRFYFQDTNVLNYSIQEAYAQIKISQYTFSVGRKILDWNPSEKYWGLGLLNGNQAFSLLSSEEEGIMGANLNSSFGPFIECNFFLSYFFIPQINPAVNFKNGEVKSKSDWVRLPPRKTIINGQEVPIYYSLDKIDVSKIILNKSIGANLKIKWNRGFISGFAIYKPENRLRANASAYYDNITLNQVVVKASPTVNHHANFGVRIDQNLNENFNLNFGITYVDPNSKLGKDIPLSIHTSNKVFKSEYFAINPQFEKETFSHASLNYTNFKDLKFSLNYIHLLSGNVRKNDDFFNDSVKWNRAIGGSVSYNVSNYFRIYADLKYDLERFDNILKGELIYNYKNKTFVSIGLEILKAPNDSSYWSYYRANDLLYSNIGFYF